uniref:hypothetical protein n=1 Tax=Gemmiger formicilis TaxID=745368 RepID=UPI0040281615
MENKAAGSLDRFPAAFLLVFNFPMPTEAAANVVNIIFFFSILFIWLLICAGENRPGNACTGKAVLGQKSLKDGEFGAVYGWAGIGTDAARTRPNRGASRGDRGGVRECCGLGLHTTSC